MCLIGEIDPGKTVLFSTEFVSFVIFPYIEALHFRTLPGTRGVVPYQDGTIPVKSTEYGVIVRILIGNVAACAEKRSALLLASFVRIRISDNLNYF